MLHTVWTNEASLHPKSMFIFFWKNFSYLTRVHVRSSHETVDEKQLPFAKLLNGQALPVTARQLHELVS